MSHYNEREGKILKSEGKAEHFLRVRAEKARIR
jgi:hypothetical protein